MPTDVKKRHSVIFRALQFIFLNTWHLWISGDKIHTCIGPRGKNSKTRYQICFSCCSQEKRHYKRKTCYKSLACVQGAWWSSVWAHIVCTGGRMGDWFTSVIARGGVARGRLARQYHLFDHLFTRRSCNRGKNCNMLLFDSSTAVHCCSGWDGGSNQDLFNEQFSARQPATVVGLWIYGTAIS